MKFIRFCSNVVITVVVFLSASFTASAVPQIDTVPVPEPGMLPLFAIGAAIAFIIKKRRK